MDETLLTELRARQTAVDELQSERADVLERRNAYMAELREHGVGAAEQARVLSTVRAEFDRGPVNRVTIAKLIGAPDAPVVRDALTDEQRDRLAALQRRLEQLGQDREPGLVREALDRRNAYFVELQAHHGVGPIEQADALEVNRNTVQRVLDADRAANRLRGHLRRR